MSAVYVAALAACLWLAVVVVLPRLRRRRRRRLRRYFSDLPEPRWTDASPLGRPVVDCRGYSRLAVEADAVLAARFHAAVRSPLSAVADRLPDGADPAGWAVDWRLNAGGLAKVRAGFVPRTPEERWLIHHHADRLYFQRSWSGKLAYVVALDAAGARRLWARGAPDTESGQLLTALVRYLIDSHLLERPAAVPVPADLADDVQRMAAFAFSFAGRLADWAEPFVPAAPPPGPEG